MFKFLKQTAKYVGTFLGVIALFNLFLYLVCTCDSANLETNAKESSQTLSIQGIRPTVFYPLGVEIDNMTDALIINEIVSVDCTQPLESYIKVRKNYRQGQTTSEAFDINGAGVSAICDESGQERVGSDVCNHVKELDQFLTHRNHTSINYGRYWHGYLALYRPLLICLNITQIRYLLVFVFTGFYALLLYMLRRRFGVAIAIIFGASLLGSGYFTAALSLQCAPIFLLLMVSSVILLRCLDKMKDFGLFIFVVGCVANFVDYLTVPLTTLGLLSSIYLLKKYEEGQDWKQGLHFLAISSVLWVLGYGGTWACKWILYDCVSNNGPSMIGIAIQQVMIRTARHNSYGSVFGNNYINLILAILGRSSLFVLITQGLVFGANKWAMTIHGFNKQALPFLVLATYPAIWYFVLANHTIYHYYFTYRQSAVFMIGILLAIHTLDVSATSRRSPNHLPPDMAIPESNSQ